MTPFDYFKDWLTTYVETAGYSLTMGMWIEPSAIDQKKYVSMWVEGGRTPDMDIDYPQIRLVITGRRNGRDLGDTVPTVNFANDILAASKENYKTDCIANVKRLGSIQGPFFTENGRPWVEINFELTV